MPPRVDLPPVAHLLMLSPGGTARSRPAGGSVRPASGSFGRMARSATGESVLSRAVRIFEAFTPDERVLSVSQIARRARLHLATASRLIAELESHGLLDREPDRRVRVGARMRELAQMARATDPAARPSRPAGAAGSRPDPSGRD